jgi:hypothetical protein
LFFFCISKETYPHQNRLLFLDSCPKAAFDDLNCWWKSSSDLYQMSDLARTWLFRLYFRKRSSRRSSVLKRWSIWWQNNMKTNWKFDALLPIRELNEEFYLWSHSGNRSVQIISECRANEIHALYLAVTQWIENRIVSWNANGETFRVRRRHIVASWFGRTAQKCGSITLFHPKLHNNISYDNKKKIHNIKPLYICRKLE